MGCFDSLFVNCLTCETAIEFQSKAGECRMAEYTLSDCPPDVAGALNGVTRQCPECGSDMTLRTISWLVVE